VTDKSKKSPILGHKYEKALTDSLISLDRTAKALRTARLQNGAIAFEAEEVRFELDEKGKPIRVYKKQIQDTNKLIEEFMLLANKHVARLIATKDKRAESVFVYRVHDAPNEDKIRDLRDFLHGVGVDLKLDKHMQVTSTAINQMLEDIRGKAEESMIQMATVRAMAKAVYTTKNIGHYGLGFEHYTHFTSPIRRYPDLMVHRLLQHYLEGKPVPKKSLEEQERLARYCSQMEVQAADAERSSIKYKQCEYF
jgi:ribonuclease R